MKQKGLTLLEVMVALFIFALTATSIMKAATEHLRALGIVESMTFANWVANNELNRVITEQRWPPQKNYKGDVELGGRTWYFRHVVSETQDADLRQIEIIVAEDKQMENEVTSMLTFIANPKPGPAKKVP